MKTRLNLTLDQDLILLSKEHAQSKGMSVSEFVEELLRKAIVDDGSTFSEKWRGKFNEAGKQGPRHERLKERFLE